MYEYDGVLGLIGDHGTGADTSRPSKFAPKTSKDPGYCVHLYIHADPIAGSKIKKICLWTPMILVLRALCQSFTRLHNINPNINRLDDSGRRISRRPFMR